MAQPTQNQVHVDRVLTNIAVAYLQNESHFISTQVFPVVPVEKQSDIYYVYTKDDWFRDEAKQRADATESAGSGYGLGTDNYRCEVWALHKDIGDQTRQNTDAPLNPDRDATQFLTQRLMLRREKEWVSKYFQSGVWGTDDTPSVLWDVYATSDPFSDIEDAKATVLARTGFIPNTFSMSYHVYKALKHHPLVRDRIKYVSADNVTEEMLARLFDLERVHVAKAIENTGKEGETGAYAFTHGKHALLSYSAPAPSLLAPSAGYTFSWRGVSQGMGKDIGVSKFRMQHLKADRVETEIAFNNKVVGADLGFFFPSVVS